MVLVLFWTMSGSGGSVSPSYSTSTKRSFVDFIEKRSFALRNERSLCFFFLAVFPPAAKLAYQSGPLVHQLLLQAGPNLVSICEFGLHCDLSIGPSITSADYSAVYWWQNPCHRLFDPR